MQVKLGSNLTGFFAVWGSPTLHPFRCLWRCVLVPGRLCLARVRTLLNNEPWRRVGRITLYSGQSGGPPGCQRRVSAEVTLLFLQRSVQPSFWWVLFVSSVVFMKLLSCRGCLHIPFFQRHCKVCIRLCQTDFWLRLCLTGMLLWGSWHHRRWGFYTLTDV